MSLVKRGAAAQRLRSSEPSTAENSETSTHTFRNDARQHVVPMRIWKKGAASQNQELTRTLPFADESKCKVYANEAQVTNLCAQNARQ